MKQAQALEILKQGYHVFLTGQAGAGKTHLLNQYINYLHKHGVAVAITASTGIAATHMNGTTIHSWAGIGIHSDMDDKALQFLKRKDTLVERLKAVNVLIIDEVSMLHAKQLDLINKVLRYIREDPSPFGGVQVILSGDFFQLPPIGEKYESTKDKFAFMSQVWIELAHQTINGSPAIKVCYLSEQFRQNDDNKFGLNDILNQIRTQSVSQNAIDTLLATKNNAIDINRTRLYTHNINVDKINQDELDKLDGKAYDFIAIAMGDKELLKALKKNARTPEILTLKKGAKVMFTKNNIQDNVFNGSMGEVVGFTKKDDDELPKVKLNDGRVLVVAFDNWSIDSEDGVPLASYTQIPLCLAWAITIHKSQGMTLEAAEIDLSKTFELGQGYVALSRIRNLDGLKLHGLNHKSLQLDSFAAAANRRFLNLSDECETWLNHLDHQTIADAQAKFLENNANKENKKTTNANEPNSIDQTLALIKQKKTIAQIAKERGLATSTIIEHLGKLTKNQRLSTEAISHLAPSDTVLTQVKSALASLDNKNSDDIKLRPIYDQLNASVDFQTLRLALIFIRADSDFNDDN